jgi:hypothetical protein
MLGRLYLPTFIQIDGGSKSMHCLYNDSSQGSFKHGALRPCTALGISWLPASPGVAGCPAGRHSFAGGADFF